VARALSLWTEERDLQDMLEIVDFAMGFLVASILLALAGFF
jgi:hypothetical protein